MRLSDYVIGVMIGLVMLMLVFTFTAEVHFVLKYWNYEPPGAGSSDTARARRPLSAREVSGVP